MYSRDTEIRRMTSTDVYKLGQILDPTNAWKKLMQLIPKEPFANDVTAFKYGTDDIRLVENASCKQNRMATEILFEEWGTSGKKRPTVGVLLELLVKAELFRAADFVALQFLNEPPPDRPLKGPAAKIDMDSEEIRNVEEMLNDVSYPGTNTLNDNVNTSSSMNNNKDYFEKFAQSHKQLDIEPENLIAFSVTTISSVSSTIPIIPDLLPDLHDDTTNQSAHNSGNHDIQLQGASIRTSLNGTSSMNVLNSEIPMLSALDDHTHNQQPTTDSDLLNSDTDLLPDISALHEIRQDHPSPSSNSNSSSSLSSNCSAPNLSILDQRSNNDSSLTNITETSGENSFDMSSGSFVSNDNIPCLSILK